MNLDLLKKLTRLATNNPNENEANLAARRVCKMLIECDFNLSNGRIPPSSTYGVNSTEPFDPIEFIRKMSREKRDNRYYAEWSPKEYTYSKPDNEREVDYNPITQMYTMPDGEQISAIDYQMKGYKFKVKVKKENKKEMKCSKCGHWKNTGFGGPPQTFICITCIWQDYQGIRK